MGERWWRAARVAGCLVALGPGGLRAQAATANPYLPVGIFIGQVEEGARIFTPVRLLPFDHPEALGHEFPTVLQLRGTEYPALVWLGERAGLRLRVTLQRYPTEPSPEWPYPEFSPPPDTLAFRDVQVRRLARQDAPIPGLRAVLYADRRPVVFIVDTRGLTLAARGMRLPTAMGLDLDRAEFLAGLARGSVSAPMRGVAAVIYEP